MFKNEIKVPLTSKSPKIKVEVENVKELTALLDTGANASLISKSALKDLQRIRSIPIAKEGFKLKGLFPSEKDTQVVYLDIVIGGKIITQQAPFAVLEDIGHSMIIGSNIINACFQSSKNNQIMLGFLGFDLNHVIPT